MIKIKKGAYHYLIQKFGSDETDKMIKEKDEEFSGLLSYDEICIILLKEKGMNEFVEKNVLLRGNQVVLIDIALNYFEQNEELKYYKIWKECQEIFKREIKSRKLKIGEIKN